MTDPTSCPPSIECSMGEQYCPLLAACQPILQPCNCHAVNTSRCPHARTRRDVSAQTEVRKDDGESSSMTNYAPKRNAGKIRDFASHGEKPSSGRDGNVAKEDDDDDDGDEGVNYERTSEGHKGIHVQSMKEITRQNSAMTHRQKRDVSSNVPSNRYNGHIPDYVLVGKTTVNVPTGGQNIYRVDIEGIHVLADDVIGFQTTDSLGSTVYCDKASGDTWGQSKLQISQDDWINLKSKLTDVEQALWTEDTVCHIQAVYNKMYVIDVPSQLELRHPIPGTLNFTLTATNALSSSTASHKVWVEIPIYDMELLHPKFVKPTPSAVGTILIETGVPMTFLVKVTNGTHPVAFWDKSKTGKVLTSTCPPQLSARAGCSNVTSEEKFSYERFVFNSPGGIMKRFTIEVRNNVSRICLVFNLDIQERISNLTLLQTGLSPLRINQTRNYNVRTKTGTNKAYKWVLLMDGRILTSAAKPTFSCVFPSGGVYTICVTVSNLLNTDEKCEEEIIPHAAKPNILDLLNTTLKSLVNTSFVAVFQFEATTDSVVTVLCDFGDGSNTSQTIEIVNYITEVNCNHTYTYTSNFMLTFTVMDPYSSMHINHSVLVGSSIGSVTVSSGPAVGTVNESVLFTAQPEKSDKNLTIIYIWNFGDGHETVQSSNRTLAKVYTNVGAYNVSVIASNGVVDVSSQYEILIEIPITGLKLVTLGPFLVRSLVNITADVISGSHVSYSFHSGSNGTDNFTTPCSEPYVVHMFPYLSMYNVTCRACNSLSCEEKSAAVMAIENDTLILQGILHSRCVPVNKDSRFFARLINLHPNQLLYLWDFGDGGLLQGKQIVLHKYQMTANYTVNVTVSNMVNTLTVLSNVCVQNVLYSMHINTTSLIALKKNDTIRTAIYISISKAADSYVSFYGDVGSLKQTSVESWVTYRDFMSYGNYSIKLKACNAVSCVRNMTTIHIVQIIENLTLEHNGTTTSKGHYFQTGEIYMFRASVTSGSEVWYEWGNKGQPGYTGQERVFSFTEPGPGNFTLAARNPVSEQSLVFCGNIQDPVTGLTLLANVSVVDLAETVLFTALLQRGTDVRYVWKYCENCPEEEKSEQNATSTFFIGGEHLVTLIAYNEISKETATIMIHVLQVIKGLTIRVNLTADQFAAVGQQVTLRSHVEEGTAISYHWELLKLDSNNSIKLQTNYVSISHVFKEAGEYTVILKASNRLGKQQTRRTIIIHEVVTDLILHSEKNLVPTGEAVVFNATIATGTNVTYRWRIKEYNTWVQFIPETFASVVYQFPRPGVFSIFVTASNPLNTLRASRVIMVEEPIVELEIKAVFQGDPYIPSGKKITYVAVAHSGSNIKFYWTFGNDRRLYNGTYVNHTFTDVGLYSILLNATNRLGSVTFIKNITAQERIDTLTVSVDSVIAEPGNILIFQTDLVKGSHVTYEWNFDDFTPPLTGTAEKISHMFAGAGSYTVKVKAWNKISSQSSSLVVTIQERVTGVKIGGCCDPIQLGAERYFSVISNFGSHKRVHWSLFADNHTTFIRNYSGPVFNHVFNLNGSLALQLIVWNDVSEVNILEVLRVLTPVDGLQIKSSNDPHHLYPNQTTLYSAFVIQGDNVSYLWNFSDGFVLRTKGNTIQRVIRVAGNYSLLVTAYNAISQESRTIGIRVEEILCEIPRLTMVSGINTTLQALKSRDLILEVSFSTNDCTAYRVLHRWRIFRTAQCSNIPEEKEVVLPLHVFPLTPFLRVPAWTLAYGQYCAVFTTSYQDTAVKVSVHKELEVSKSPLMAVIFGGSSRDQPWNHELVLNGSQSYDPDLPRNTRVNYTYTWECSTEVSVKISLIQTEFYG